MLRDCSTSRGVCWQCSLDSIRNPASNSRPPISRRQSTFGFHFCNRLHCPAQSKLALNSPPKQTRAYVPPGFRRARRGTRLSVVLPALARRFPAPRVAMRPHQLHPDPRTIRVTGLALLKRPSCLDDSTARRRQFLARRRPKAPNERHPVTSTVCIIPKSSWRRTCQWNTNLPVKVSNRVRNVIEPGPSSLDGTAAVSCQRRKGSSSVSSMPLI